MVRGLLANWELKLAALVLAASGWFFVASADRSQIAFAAPVEYVGLLRDLVVVGHLRESVEVQAEAARWALPRLTPSSVRVRVDLGDLEEGEHSVRLAP
ncbi:MAG TPA: hypothetical protein VFX28_01630, partial [Methylomirabilota bacterium]|nr:hypothetical protein [Methylomirabilota bacterium]